MVGRAVHRHHALFRQDVVEQRKDRFFVLAGIGGIADQNQLLVEVQRDDGFRTAAVFRRVGLEAGAVDDGEIGHEAGQFRGLGAPQQVADEKPVPCQFRHDPHIKAQRRISAAIEVLNEIVLAFHMLQHIGMKPVKGFGLHRLVVFPPDGVFHRGGAYDVLVLGRAAGMRAGRDQESAAKAKLAFTALQGRLDQRRFKQVIVNLAEARDPLVFETAIRVDARLGHGSCAPARIPGRQPAVARPITRHFPGESALIGRVSAITHS